MKPIIASEPDALEKPQPLWIRVQQAADLSGLSTGSIRKLISQRRFKTRVYSLGRGHNRARLIHFQSFVSFLNSLPEELES
jgi:hypothetical protein